MKHFTITPQTTEAELQKQKRDLSNLHHPDKYTYLGTDAEKQANEIQQEINAEFIEAIAQINNFSFADTQMFTALIAGLNTVCETLGYGTLEDAIHDKLINKLVKQFIPEKYQLMVMLFIKTQAPDVPTAFRTGEKVFKDIRKSIKK